MNAICPPLFPVLSGSPSIAGFGEGVICGEDVLSGAALVSADGVSAAVSSPCEDVGSIAAGVESGTVSADANDGMIPAHITASVMINKKNILKFGLCTSSPLSENIGLFYTNLFANTTAAKSSSVIMTSIKSIYVNFSTLNFVRPSPPL